VGGESEWMIRLLDQLPVGVALLDRACRVVSLNPTLAGLAGVEPDVATGKRLVEIFPELAPTLGAMLLLVFESGQTLHGIEIAGATQRFVLTAFSVPPGIGVTIQVKAPASPSWSPLLDRDMVFRAIFDRTAIGMSIIDWRGGGARVNAAFCKMLGYTAEELTRVGIQAITHPDDWERDLTEFRRLMANEIDHYQLEKRYVRKDGSVFWGHLLVSTARDESPQPSFLVTMVEDVTERRQAEEGREQLILALEEAVRTRETFLSVASHELKTPLMPLQISLELLRKTLDDKGSVARLDRAMRQVDRLTALVDKLLDVSRIATGKLPLTLTTVDLHEEAREAIERLRVEAERMGSRIMLVATGPVLVQADRARVEQILTNLVGNAIKFGAGQPIEVEVRAEPEMAVIVVRDRGIGIAVEDQERIFGRFERAASDVRYGGLGLGLFISHEIAQAHDGRIRVESVPGEGAKFVLELPFGPRAP
jgi:PAS domain S-box-containing protein